MRALTSVKSTIRRRAVSTSSTSVFTPTSLRDLPIVMARCQSGGRCVGGPVAPPGRCPRKGRGGSCTHALPLSRRNRRPSTQELRTFAMPSCPDFRRWTGVSACRCWPTSETGRCIATTAWETEEAMRASAEQVAPVRDQAAQAFGGSAARRSKSGRSRCCTVITAQVEGACARATWVKVPPDQLDGASSFTRRLFCPSSRHSRGSAAPACWSIARRGRAVSSVDFRQPRSDGSQQRSRQRSLRTREDSANSGADELDDGEFELRARPSAGARAGLIGVAG